MHGNSHFKGKDPLSHVIEKRNEGIASLMETHGTELPGPIGAMADAMRESSLYLLLFFIVIHLLAIFHLWSFIAFGLGIVAWKCGRAAWLGWNRLERLHRLIEQERYEIEHHREQEREELAALYHLKGFEGKLLEEVVDVLMADQDRLLKVMVEEELGLTLEAHEHPLKEALGAFLGSFIALLLISLGFYFFKEIGLLIAAFLSLTGGVFLSVKYEQNRLIPAIIWNLALAALAAGITAFLTLAFR